MSNALKYIFLLLIIPPAAFSVSAQQPAFWAEGGTGMMGYFGDLPSGKLNGTYPLAWQAGIGYRKGGASLSLNAGGGYIFGNDRLSKDLLTFQRSLNFRTQIRHYSLLAQLYLHKQGTGRFAPYVCSGIGVTSFDVWGDLYHGQKQDQRYFYWADGSIRKGLPGHAGEGAIIRQDGIFETQLTNLGTERDNSYATRVLHIPAGIGFNLRISNRLQADLRYLLYLPHTDYLDDVSGAYRSSYPSGALEYAANPSGVERPLRGKAGAREDAYSIASIGLRYAFWLPKRRAPKVQTEKMRAPRKNPVSVVEQDALAAQRYQQRPDTVFVLHNDTVYLTRTQTLRMVQTDTIRLIRTDTVYLARTDTLFVPRTEFVTRTDTVYVPQPGASARQGAGEVTQLMEDFGKIRREYDPDAPQAPPAAPAPGTKIEAMQAFLTQLTLLNAEMARLRETNTILEYLLDEHSSKDTARADTALPMQESPAPANEADATPDPAPAVLSEVAPAAVAVEKPEPAPVVDAAPAQATAENPRPVIAEAPAPPAPPKPAAANYEIGLILPALEKEILQFGFNQSALDSTHCAQLTDVAKLLAAYPELGVLVSGHADANGSPAANLEISMRRAAAAADWLLAYPGVQAHQVHRYHYGQALSAGKGRADRRVEVDFIKVR